MLELQRGRGRIDQLEIHDILSNGRRRNVIKHLERRLTPVSLRELSERIAEAETGESPAPRNVRESVYNSLHQTHLPKLDEAGIVTYEKDRKMISLREPARQVDLYMEVVTRYGFTWAGYYRSLGVVALMAIVVSSAEFWMFSGLSTVLVASVFLLVFAVSTAYQLWFRRWFYLQMLVANVSSDGSQQ